MRFVRAPVLGGLLLLAVPLPVAGSAPLLNHPAPPFARTDLQGSRIRLTQYRSKVVLLNFWATWCATCRVEMPQFVQWQRQYGPEGLRVLGVSMDDGPTEVREFLRHLRVNYPVVMGDAKLGELYGGVLGMPVTFLIDRDGVIRARIDGQSDLRVMERKIRALLEAR